jgi:hypothetical protein
MTRTMLPAALVLLASFMTALAGEAQDKAKAQLDKATYDFFQGEIKDTYPDPVKAYAIVSATVEKANEVPYCPLRTAQCGLNATCNHVKRAVPVVDLKVGAPLLKIGDGELPKAFTNYALFGGGEALKTGDAVQVSLYVYASSPSNVSKIRKVEAAAPDKAAPEVKPKEAAGPKSLAGMSFVSKEKREVGRGVNGPAMGTWSLRFTETTVRWRYSDVVETLRYTLEPDGTITTNGSMRPGSIKAHYFPDRKEIQWDGVDYKVE